ncbi:TonB-dependent receptor [Puteibacter caeruleilacunae]|nr:TonB-dependent receptor [Puteibacter caeruleilacunae]
MCENVLHVKLINLNFKLMKRFLSIILWIITISVNAQTRSITGIVTDSGGEPLPGATIVVKGTTNGAVTNMDGAYTINNVSSNSVLVISFVGMLTQEVQVGDQKTISIEMVDDAIGLDEVVAVGYGTVRKSDLTGSVASVKSDEISKMGTVSLDQALSGRVSGVVVNQSSGVPGGGASIKIRGINSMRGSEPLYIIDGVPMENSKLSSLSENEESGGQLSPLSMINPSDIESMEVLKDASATAIYGSRGANGVVIITTKSGKDGKGRIEVDAEYGISELPKKIDVLDSNDYWLLRAEALSNGGGDISELTAKLDSARNGLIPTTDWQDVVFRQGYTQNYNLKFSGGTDKIKYLISSNIFDTEGIVENTDFSRVSTRINLNAEVNDHLDVGTRIYYATVNSTQKSTTTNFQTKDGRNSIIMRAVVTSPTAGIDAEEDELGVEYYTPKQALEANNYDNQISQFLGNMFLNLKLAKGLKFKTDFSYQIRNANQRFYQKNILPKAYSRGGWAITNDSRVRSYSNTNTLNYNLRKRNHRFNAVVGQSIEWNNNSGLKTSNYGYENDQLLHYAPHTARFMDPDIVRYTESKLVSFFGRANYTFKDKLLLTFTARGDGSSKFAANNKWAFFPAGAIGYRLSEEKFIKEIEQISNVKLRVSYGISGNQAIGAYQSLDQFASSKHTLGTGTGEGLTPVYYQSQLPNPNLQWETTAQGNFGLDFGLWDNRLSATIDYYNKRTKNLLVVGNRIPSQSGFTTFTENNGTMESNGLEVGLNAYIVEKPRFSWNAGVSISTGKTRITSMSEDYFPSGYNQGWVAGGTQRLIIGDELGAFYGLKTNGIAQFDDFVEFQGLDAQQQIDLYKSNPNGVYTPVLNDEGVGVIAKRPGEQLFVDKNGDGQINELDKQVIGYAQPDMVVGFNSTMDIGNFQFSFFIDGQFGHEVTNVTNFKLLAFDDRQKLALTKQRWTAENPSKVYPRLDPANSSASAFKYSDRYIEDASFVRLQNVTLTYNIPEKLTKKIKVNNAKIFVSGSNLLVMSDYTGYSPDVSLNGSDTQKLGHDNAGYPVARSYRIGLNLKF